MRLSILRRLCAGRLGKVGIVSLSSRLVGMHYRYPDYYEVDREQIRQYALAVKNRNATFFDRRRRCTARL